MNAALRFFTEYHALNRVLDRRDIASVFAASIRSAPAILRSSKLTALDAAMSRNLTVHFDGATVALPLADVDQLLTHRKDNPTFGNLREMYARNCYLRRLKLKKPVRAILDLGANRGLFSLLALTALGSEIAVGVEPTIDYDAVFQLLLQANQCAPDRAPRYRKFVSSPTIEREAPVENVSIQTILREQGIDRFNLVKMDIEGHEATVFSEPEWLARADNISMELHPDKCDLSMIPRALDEYGFQYVLTDQHGKPASGRDATFLYASCTGELIG
jgi:hypothetical protein